MSGAQVDWSRLEEALASTQPEPASGLRQEGEAPKEVAHPLDAALTDAPAGPGADSDRGLAIAHSGASTGVGGASPDPLEAALTARADQEPPLEPAWDLVRLMDEEPASRPEDLLRAAVNGPAGALEASGPSQASPVLPEFPDAADFAAPASEPSGPSQASPVLPEFPDAADFAVPASEPWSDDATSIAELKARLAAFVAERDWARFHRPKDLAMAVSVEAGELLQLFLWVDPATPGGRPEPERARLEAEIADVAICLLNLCNRTGIDLAQAIERKLEHNAAKYPVARARGSALKYDEYEEP